MRLRLLHLMYDFYYNQMKTQYGERCQLLYTDTDLLLEYVGLRPKMYSILEASGKSIKKAKGLKKNTMKKHLHYKQYKEVLFEKQTFRHGIDVLRSKRHHIYGQRLNKVSLSPSDCKRWIAENVLDTLAYGHKDAIPAG